MREGRKRAGPSDAISFKYPGRKYRFQLNLKSIDYLFDNQFTQEFLP